MAWLPSHSDTHDISGYWNSGDFEVLRNVSQARWIYPWLSCAKDENCEMTIRGRKRVESKLTNTQKTFTFTERTQLVENNGWSSSVNYAITCDGTIVAEIRTMSMLWHRKISCRYPRTGQVLRIWEGWNRWINMVKYCGAQMLDRWAEYQ